MSLPLGGLLAVVVALLAPWEDDLVAPTALESAALDPHQAFEELVSTPAERAGEPTRSDVLRSGQTLGGVLDELGLSAADAYGVAEAARRYLDLRQLRPGVRWDAWGEGDGLERFRLALADKGELDVRRAQGGWEPSFREYRRETRVRAIGGRLDGALETSIERVGADGMLAYEMADVLQWDLDFTRDLRTGDEFRLLFEENWLEGEYRSPGRILALRYGREGGPTWQAYEFRGQGYYDADGRPLKKMFLRSPLRYSRITSRFSNRRFHPILKVFRPHYGVDYGAPVGTPARATASGTVIFAGWDGGGGRTVKIRHPNEYVTCYLHLSRIGKGIRPGVRIQQGEVVGFVGSTGLATAPHLDYRVRHRGQWINPLSLASVPAEPLSSQKLGEFRALQAAMLTSLETGHAYLPPVSPSIREPSRLTSVAGSTARAR